MATSLRTPALVTAAQATTFIDVHAIVPDPSFFNGKDPQAIKKAITVMLDGASATYASLGLRFRFSALELTSEPVLAKDRGPGITLSGPPLNFEMPRTARATHYPGRLVVFFRSYVGGPTSVAFNYSSYFADYVVMGNLNGTSFAHEVGHHLGLSHTHSDDALNKIFEANRDRGYQAALEVARELIRQAGGPSCFDGDSPGVKDTPPDPGPAIFQPSGYDAAGNPQNPTEHCSGTVTLGRPGHSAAGDAGTRSRQHHELLRRMRRRPYLTLARPSEDRPYLPRQRESPRPRRRDAP